MTRAEKRQLSAEAKRCREGGRPCRFCDKKTDLRVARLRGWA
jgi:hypothetical protein